VLCGSYDEEVGDHYDLVALEGGLWDVCVDAGCYTGVAAGVGVAACHVDVADPAVAQDACVVAPHGGGGGGVDIGPCGGTVDIGAHTGYTLAVAYC
jgi:hypothetical protein